MFLLALAAVTVLSILSWNLYRRNTSHGLDKLNDQRRATSRIVSRGEFVDGSRCLEVALALTDKALYYESSEIQASLDLEWIEEVDYDTELATGRSVTGGEVLRLRCHRQVFEFILPNEVAVAWKNVLPATRPLRTVDTATAEAENVA